MNTEENDIEAELALWELLVETRDQLTTVTEQRDAVTLRLGKTQEKMFDAERHRDRLAEAIRLTLMDNLDLCDGDVCTLKRLKDAIGFDLDSLEI